MRKGKFIAVSGGEGSGKTSLFTFLKKSYPEAIFTREPGGTPVGAAIRDILLDRHELDPTPEAELFLFFADRAEHINTVVAPSTKLGKHVFSDRYWMDTFAYQWWASMKRTDINAFMQLILAAGFPDPDLLIWLDIDPKVGITRRFGTGLFNRIDVKTLAFHRRVREGFTQLVRTVKFPYVRIDASKSFDEVRADVQQSLQKFLSI
ncbi:MAG: dTMP kinase [Candidatus Kerfeldbacteria bacterium]